MKRKQKTYKNTRIFAYAIFKWQKIEIKQTITDKASNKRARLTKQNKMKKRVKLMITNKPTNPQSRKPVI